MSIGFYAALLPSVWLWVFLLGFNAWPLCKWLDRVLPTNRFPVATAMTLGATLITLAAMTALYGLRLHHICI